MFKKSIGKIIVEMLDKRDRLKPMYCRKCIFFYNPWCLHKRNITVKPTWDCPIYAVKAYPSALNRNNDCFRYKRKLGILHSLYFAFVINKRVNLINF